MPRSLFVFLVFSLALAACSPVNRVASGNGQPTEVLIPAPTASSMRATRAAPTMSAAPTEPATVKNWLTYTSADGYFSISYPAGYGFYENEVPDAAGDVSAAPGTIAIGIIGQDPLILTIQHTTLDELETLSDFMGRNDACVVRWAGEVIPLGGQAAWLYRDTGCAPGGRSVLYAGHGSIGYRIDIISDWDYALVERQVRPILDTFQFVETTGPTPAAADSLCLSIETLTAQNGQIAYQGISFHLDPALATRVTAQQCQAVPFRVEDLPGTAHPAGVTFTFPTERQRVAFQPLIAVYTVEGDMQDYPYPLNSLPDLQRLLDKRREPSPWFDHAPLHARPQYLDFASGAGVRGIIEYMQDIFFYTNNGLLYNFDGLTSDGRYSVNVRVPVAVPFLMDLEGSDPLANTNPQAIPVPNWPNDYEQEGPIVEVYNQEALRRFDQATDADFTPDLALLDSLVRSLKIVAP